MLQRTPPALLIAAFCLVSAPGIAQTTLSQNSGINSADTWVVMDVTAQTKNVSITTSSPVYNPTTKTTSSTLSVAPVAQSFHIEAGYDSSGGLVMNLRRAELRPTPTPRMLPHSGSFGSLADRLRYLTRPASPCPCPCQAQAFRSTGR